MAFILADRVKESCSSPGTGTVTLLGAATGYQSFSAGIGANNTTYYVIADQVGSNWEVGYGTIGSGGTTLARTTVLSSSNSGSLVNFASGTQDVFCDYTAKTALYVTNTGSQISLQAQATDSTATGGNARGANAVDWQTSRGSANQVASGAGSFLGGGVSNISSGTYSVLVGGSTGQATAYGTFVGGGYGNKATINQSSVVAGENNTASGQDSFIGAGHLNTSTGWLNFIGGGEANSTTANAAVTTQAVATNGVTSGSTAVTLAASNAAIKVGQLITGTGIVGAGSATNYTYVAAISGTSLTLSQNANATGTPTLSFYTPHGVVVGGGNNQATGSYSFIGGGGDAGTAANRNTASGDWSFVGGGAKNTASGTGSVVAGGGYNYPNTSSGLNSTVSGGGSNAATSSFDTITGGYNNTASGGYGTAGGRYSTTRGIYGEWAYAAGNNTTQGDAQAALLVLRNGTTDATPTVLTSNQSAASTTNQVILPNNSAYYVRGSIVAGVTGAGNSSSCTFQGTIKRGANAASTVIVGTGITATLVSQDAGAATWAVSITADTTNGGLAVTVTGAAATTIRWVCKVETTEMTY
jgi:hypothetical protein